MCVLFVSAGTPSMSLWSRSAQRRGTRALWERTRPSSTSTKSRSICTRSKETWSIWCSATLRCESEGNTSDGVVCEKNIRIDRTLSLFCMFHTESSGEDSEVPRGASHAFLPIHSSLYNLHHCPVSPVLLLRHVQVRLLFFPKHFQHTMTFFFYIIFQHTILYIFLQHTTPFFCMFFKILLYYVVFLIYTARFYRYFRHAWLCFF